MWLYLPSELSHKTTIYVEAGDSKRLCFFSVIIQKVFSSHRRTTQSTCIRKFRLWLVSQSLQTHSCLMIQSNAVLQINGKQFKRIFVIFQNHIPKSLPEKSQNKFLSLLLKKLPRIARIFLAVVKLPVPILLKAPKPGLLKLAGW